MSKLLLALSLSMIMISCQKEQSIDVAGRSVGTAGTNLTLLQTKWLLDSLIVYPSTGLSSITGIMLKITDLEYADFRTDNKVYSYGGTPTPSYDTAVYKLLPDNTVFLAYQITNGVASPIADTGYILKLTPTSLQYYSITAARDYVKWIWKK